MNDKIYVNARFLTQKLTGVQRFAYEISRQLSINLKQDVVLLIPKKSQILSFYNYPFLIEKIGSNLGHFWEQIDLYFFLKRNKNPLLINLTNSGPILYNNQISTVHDISFYFNKSWYPFMYRNLYKIITPLLIRNSFKIITVSEFSRKTIINHFKVHNSKIMVINNAISMKINNNKKDLLSDNYLLFVGANSKRKNLINVLKAFNEISVKNLKIKIVGLGKMYNTRDSLFSNKNIEIINNIDDIALSSLYRNAKMLIFPSFYEGFGIPPLEAMQFKCPVIASDIPVFKELYGDAVFYVNPNSIAEIKDSIITVLNNHQLRSKLINSGSKLLKKYSWKNSASKLIITLNKLSN